MGTTNIPLTTLTPNQVVDSSVIPALTQPVGSFTDFQLLVNRNVGANPLDSMSTAPASNIQIKAEYSNDGGTTWHLGMSAAIPGGAMFADKAQTIRQETSAIDWPFKANFPGATHIRGTVTNGASTVSVSGSATLS